MIKNDDSFQPLSKSDLDGYRKRLEELIDFDQPFWKNPFQINVGVIGGFCGLDISFKALRDITLLEDENTFFVYSQESHLDDFSFCYQFFLNDANKNWKKFPHELSYMWSSDFLLFFSFTYEWFIIFSADLSLGIFVVRSEVEREKIQSLSRQFARSNELCSLETAIFECREDISRYGDYADIKNSFLKSFALAR